MSNIKGSINWNNNLPETFEHRINFDGTDYDGGKYEFTFDIQGEDESISRYKITGKEIDKTLTRIE